MTDAERLKAELKGVIGMLRRVLAMQSTVTNPLDGALERVGALTFAVEQAKAQLEQLIQEAA